MEGGKLLPTFYSFDKDMSDIIITKLVYPETVRQNIGMYLGTISDFTTPLREIINNSTDELINGHASWIKIYNSDKLKVVIDNGRGMPIYADPDNLENTIAKAAVGSLHAGSKIADSMETTAGVHGVGASAVNAVSEEFNLVIRLKDENVSTTTEAIKHKYTAGASQVYSLCYQKGILVREEVTTIEEISSKYGYILKPDFSTAVFIKPDLSLYNSGYSEIPLLPLQITAANFLESEIYVNDELVQPFNFIKEIAGEDTELFLDQTIDFKFKYRDTITISGIIAYDNNTMQYTHTSLVNLIETTQGGFFEDMVVKALGTALTHWSDVLSPSDVKLGLIAFSNTFTSYKLSFASQTKERLISVGMRSDQSIIEKMSAEGYSQDEIDEECYKHCCYTNEVRADLIAFFERLIKNNSQYFNALVERIVEYKRQLNKLSNKDFIKSKLVFGGDSDRARSSTEASKVYEATSRDYDRRELYVTEGLSASGSLIQMRNSSYQSILPLRGKVLNSVNLDETDVVNNAELLALINTIGCGLGDLTDISQSRYGKVIIATDADVDGEHITNLILAVFLAHCPELIKSGMVYKLKPPYYAVTDKKGYTSYFNIEDKDKIDFDNNHVEKRKGLGSYTKPEVKRFMIDGSTRNLIRIDYDSDDELVRNAMSLLYSSSARRNLMIERGVLKG